MRGRERERDRVNNTMDINVYPFGENFHLLLFSLYPTCKNHSKFFGVYISWIDNSNRRRKNENNYLWIACEQKKVTLSIQNNNHHHIIIIIEWVTFFLFDCYSWLCLLIWWINFSLSMSITLSIQLNLHLHS